MWDGMGAQGGHEGGLWLRSRTDNGRELGDEGISPASPVTRSILSRYVSPDDRDSRALEVTATLPHDSNLDRGLTAPPKKRVAPEVSGPAESQARYGHVEGPRALRAPARARGRMSLLGRIPVRWTKRTGRVMWQMAPSLEPTNLCASIDCTRDANRGAGDMRENLRQEKRTRHGPSSGLPT
jgi:hypothetical protein